MRMKALALASLVAACPWQAVAQPLVPGAVLSAPPSASTAPLTLAQVLDRAGESSPAVLTRQAQRTAVEGARLEAGALLYNNPQLALDRSRRMLPAAPGQREWSLGLSQTFETGGQQGQRQALSEAGQSAWLAELDDARRTARTGAAQAFFRVLALQQRAALDEEALRTFDSTAAAVAKRRQAGEDTRLDANVAAAEAGRARNQLAQSREALADARADLAALLRLPPSQAPEVSGDLAEGAQRVFVLADVLTALEAQPRLRAAAARESGAAAKVRLEQASRYPDLTVGLSSGREGASDARERVNTVSVSLPLPLFRRNEAGIGQAVAEREQARLDLEFAQREARAQAHSLSARVSSLQDRVQRLQQQVLPALLDNQQLSIKSQRAGQIGLLELIVVQRQALDGRRDLVDALLELQTARLALEALAGLNP